MHLIVGQKYELIRFTGHNRNSLASLKDAFDDTFSTGGFSLSAASVFVACVVRRKRVWENENAYLLFVCLLFFLLFVLLFLCRAHHENPFVAPWGDWFVRQNSKGEWELDCIYNLLAFLPFSFLCGLLRGKVFRSILVCGIVSCLFECLQAYFSVGAFQISDIVYNALSGGIGAGLYSIIHKH